MHTESSAVCKCNSNNNICLHEQQLKSDGNLSPSHTHTQHSLFSPPFSPMSTNPLKTLALHTFMAIKSVKVAALQCILRSLFAVLPKKGAHAPFCCWQWALSAIICYLVNLTPRQTAGRGPKPAELRRPTNCRQHQ